MQTISKACHHALLCPRLTPAGGQYIPPLHVSHLSVLASLCARQNNGCHASFLMPLSFLLLLSGVSGQWVDDVCGAFPCSTCNVCSCRIPTCDDPDGWGGSTSKTFLMGSMRTTSYLVSPTQLSKRCWEWCHDWTAPYGHGRYSDILKCGARKEMIASVSGCTRCLLIATLAPWIPMRHG